MAAPDLEAFEVAIEARLRALVNPHDGQPLLRSVFNMEDESIATDETGAQRAISLPAVGIIHEDEPWEDDEILGHDVSHDASEYWTLVLITEAPKAGGGVRGPRGLYRLSGVIFDSFDGWQILPGCPVAVKRRTRYRPRNENGELLPYAGHTIEIAHPVSHQATLG